MAIVIPADVTQPLQHVEPKNGTDFQLAELYKLLNCQMIEIRQVTPELIMVLDEEGKLRDMPRNERATILADFVTPMQLVALLLQAREAGITVMRLGEPITDMTTEVDYIAGDVLICNANEVR